MSSWSLFAKAGHAADRSFTIGRGFTIQRRYETPKQRDVTVVAAVTVDVDRNIVNHKDPAGRSNWLQGALLDVAKGAMKNDIVWDIVEQDAFARGMDNTVGSHVYETLLSNLHVFSKSQQKKLASSDFHLNIFKPAPKPVEDQRDSRGPWRNDRDRRDGERRRRRDDDSRDDSRERHRCSRDRPEGEEEPGRKKRKRRRRTDEERRARDDESEERHKRHDDVKEKYDPAAEAEAKRKKQLVKKFELGGVQVTEEMREQSCEAQAGAKLLGQVMDQIRLVGLHEREKWSANDLHMCNERHAGLCKSLFTDSQYKAFKAQLRCFEKKEQGAGEFLQYLLQMLAEARTDVDDDDAALFVSLVVMRLENKSLRTALHERTRTLKKTLEEGRV